MTCVTVHNQKQPDVTTLRVKSASVSITSLQLRGPALLARWHHEHTHSTVALTVQAMMQGMRRVSVVSGESQSSTPQN
jgi:hypothetical protein